MSSQPLTIDQLRAVLEQTLSPQAEIRKNAEKQLSLAQRIPGHPVAVLQLLTNGDPAFQFVRQAAAVHFKNVVKGGWDASNEDGGGDIAISDGDRNLIKTHLVELMCTVPPNIQAQCAESISLIARVDFPDKWQNLLPSLVAKFNAPDQAVVNGVLVTANSIFKRFRYARRSDALYKDIIYSLKIFQEPILGLFKATGAAVHVSANDAAALRLRFETLRLICRIFFSLNYQDLPEYFEDHMGEWMEGFTKFLSYDNPLLRDDSEEDEPDCIDKLQGAIVANLELYASKDEEPFMPFLAGFTQLVWNLLLRVTAFRKHDSLATKCIQFLSSLVKKLIHRDLFKEDATLREIIGKIVIPNLVIREVDEERFEFDPQEFIATDMEATEADSRRRCSQDLLRAMCRQFEAEATRICSEHVSIMLGEYAKNPAGTWKSKDAAIHLVLGIAISAKNHHGVSRVNEAVNVMEFFSSNVLPDLQDSNHANLPMLKATSLKFVNTFRRQFTKEQIAALLPSIILHLSSPAVVVHTYAAFTIEKILTCRELENGTGPLKFDKQDLQPFLESLFTSIFMIVENQSLNDNEHVMKCVMRSLSVADEDIIPVTQVVLMKLTDALGRAAKNPSNPQYNHYLFESIAVLVKSVCKREPSATPSFEALLFPPFQTVLATDVSEFTPYVFQVFAQLLEFKPKESELGEAYTMLFTPLLNPLIWERKGNIPALTRLLTAYLKLAAVELVSGGHLGSILGVFQKLLATRSSEESAFDLLAAIVIYVPAGSLEPSLKTVFKLLLTRLQHGKSSRFLRLATDFFALYIGMYGAQAFIDQLNSIQAGLALTIIVQVWLPRLQTDAPVRLKCKIQVVALTKLLCETPVLLNHDDGKKIWALTVAAVVKLLTAGGASLVTKEEDEAPVETEIAYDSAYSSLRFARRASQDPFSGITDPAMMFVTALHGLSTTHPGQLQPLIDQATQSEPKLAAYLEVMFQKSGLTLV